MRGVDKLNIEITNGSPKVKLEMVKEGKTSIKHTSAENLSAAIANNISFNTGVLPKGTRYFGGSPNVFELIVETAPMMKVCNLFSNAREDNESGYDGHSESLPFPHLLFHFVVRNQRIDYSHIFALNKSVRTLSDDLFIFPYGNVYPNGDVCWGGAMGDIRITSPVKVIEVIARFLDSGYNADLFDSKTIRSNKLVDFGSNNNFWRFIEYMKGKKMFPVDALSKTDLRIENILRLRS